MKILIAVDGSPQAQAAIEEASASFWPEKTSFKIVSIVDSFLGVPAADSRITQANSVVEACTQALKHNLAVSGGIEGSVITGNPKTEIIKAAAAWPADLLIVGSRGRKGLSRIVLGSVSHAALMAVPCSVRIARKLTSAQPHPRVILCLDESKDSARIIARASLLHWPIGTEFLCVYALPTLSQFLYEEQSSYEIDKLAARRNQQAEQAMTTLQQVCDRLNKRIEGISARWEIIDGDPREAIVGRAKNWQATLVIMGCNGKNWINRMLVGSVSEAVATYSECSVEVVKHH